MDEEYSSGVLGTGSSSAPHKHFTLSALPYVAAYCVVLVVHTVDLFVPSSRSRRVLDAEHSASVNDATAAATTSGASGRRGTRRSTTVSQVYGRWSDRDRDCACPAPCCASCCASCCCSGSGPRRGGAGNGALGVRASGLFRLLVPAFFATRIAWWLLASAGAAPYEGVARVLNRLAFTFFVVLFGVLALLLGDALAIAVRDPAATRFAPLALTGALELGFLKRRTRVVYLAGVGVLCAAVLALAVADVATGVSTTSAPYLASTLLMAAMCLALAAAFLGLGALLVRHLRNAAVSRAVLAKVALYCAAVALCFLSRAFFLSYRILPTPRPAASRPGSTTPAPTASPSSGPSSSSSGSATSASPPPRATPGSPSPAPSRPPPPPRAATSSPTPTITPSTPTPSRATTPLRLRHQQQVQQQQSQCATTWSSTTTCISATRTRTTRDSVAGVGRRDRFGSRPRFLSFLVALSLSCTPIVSRSQSHTHTP